MGADKTPRQEGASLAGVVSRLGAKREERRRAEALELALARFNRLRSEGVATAEAASRVASPLDPELRGLFGLAAALASSRAAMPEPGFAQILETRIRERRMPAATVVPLRRPSRVSAIAAAAAVLIVAIAIGRASMSSLPGDALYGVKRRGEAVRLVMESGRSEALLRIEIADTRIDEVRSLVARERARVVGLPGRDLAAAPAGVHNPRVARLIENALRDAARQIASAADVLIRLKDPEGLDRLVAVAHKGLQTASSVAPQLPMPVQPPVLASAAAMQQIELEAASARQEPSISPTPTPAPCTAPSSSPTPSPSPSPAPKATPTPTSSPSPSPTPTSTPTPSPSPTPCATPAPSATPSPAPSPTPTAHPAESPQPSPDAATTAEPEPTERPSSEQEASHSASEPAVSNGCYRLVGLLLC
jgi:hypothetical protein